MSAEITFTRQETTAGHRLIATVAGHEGKGVMVTTTVTDTLFIINHTVVNDTLKGLGVGKALAERLIADARAAGQRIVPLCPFFRGYAAKRKEELADVVVW